MSEKQANTFRQSVGRCRVPVVALLLISSAACATRSRPPSAASEQTTNSPSAGTAIDVSPADTSSTADDPCSQMFSNLFVAMDSVSYDGYLVERLHGTIFDKATGLKVPVSYAVLKSGGREILRFEGTYFGAGNETRFGFASLLGGDTRQLVVSQTTPRNGRHWVVDLGSGGLVAFDSADWDIGCEDVCVHDFDDDGVAELSLVSRRFCGIGAMSMSECPLVSIVFKYDPSAHKYLPDRDAFVQGLDSVAEDAEQIDPAEVPPEGGTGSYLARRLDVFLRYAYGGRRQEGWSFFDKRYNLPDKKEIEQRITAVLAKDPVYNFVYRGSRASE